MSEVHNPSRASTFTLLPVAALNFGHQISGHPAAVSYLDALCHGPLADVEGIQAARLAAATAADRLVDAAARPASNDLCSARTCAMALTWCFLCPLRCSSVLVNQAEDDVSALDPGGQINCVAGPVQRRSLFSRLARPVLVIVPRILGLGSAGGAVRRRLGGGPGIRAVVFLHTAPRMSSLWVSGPAL